MNFKIKKNYLVFLLLFLGMFFSPFTKVTPFYLLTLPKVFKFKKYALILFVCLLILRLCYNSDIQIFYFFYLLVFCYIFFYINSFLDYQNINMTIKVIKKIIFLITLILLIFSIIPIDMVILLRKFFSNSFYLNDESILRKAGLFSEPSDVGVFCVFAYSLIWPFLYNKKEKLFLTLLLVILFYLNQSPVFYFLFFILLIFEIKLGYLIPNLLLKLLLILFFFLNVQYGMFLLSLFLFDQADASRYLFFIDGLVSSFKFFDTLPLNFNPNFIHLIDNPLLKNYVTIMADFQKYPSLKPNAPGLFIFKTFGFIGWIFVYWYYNRLFNIIDRDKKLLYLQSSLFLLFIQSPILIPLFMFYLFTEEKNV